MLHFLVMGYCHYINVACFIGVVLPNLFAFVTRLISSVTCKTLFFLWLLIDM